MKTKMELIAFYAESHLLLNDPSSVVFIVETSVQSIYESRDIYTFYLKKFKPTGRWRLKSSPTGQLELYLEHKGFIFNKWVNESLLVLRPPEVDVIYNCHN